MKDHLSRYMRRSATLSGEGAGELKQLFEKTCIRVLDALGSKPFHVRAGLNAAVYDSVMLAFASGQDVPKDIRDRYARLLADPNFHKVTSRSTTDEDSVKQRIELASSTLFGR
jgi:hypothetical protein